MTCELGGVGKQARRASEVPRAQHLCGREHCLERFEDLLLCIDPHKSGAGAAESSQEDGDGREAPHELTVIIC